MTNRASQPVSRSPLAAAIERAAFERPLPEVFAAVARTIEHAAGPSFEERATALVPLVRQAAEPKRPVFRVDDQANYHTYSTRTERWIDRVPPPPSGLLHGESQSQVCSWADIVEAYTRMLPGPLDAAEQFEYDRWAQGHASPDYLLRAHQAMNLAVRYPDMVGLGVHAPVRHDIDDPQFPRCCAEPIESGDNIMRTDVNGRCVCPCHQ